MRLTFFLIIMIIATLFTRVYQYTIFLNLSHIMQRLETYKNDYSYQQQDIFAKKETHFSLPVVYQWAVDHNGMAPLLMSNLTTVTIFSVSEERTTNDYSTRL